MVAKYEAVGRSSHGKCRHDAIVKLQQTAISSQAMHWRLLFTGSLTAPGPYHAFHLYLMQTHVTPPIAAVTLEPFTDQSQVSVFHGVPFARTGCRSGFLVWSCIASRIARIAFIPSGVLVELLSLS